MTDAISKAFRAISRTPGCACLLFLCSVAPAKDRFDAADRAHWAFQPLKQPAVPQVSHRDWVRNPVDSFVVAELEKEHLEPGPAADKRTLIRRAYLDLIGIPPSPREIEAFVADRSREAFGRVV